MPEVLAESQTCRGCGYDNGDDDLCCRLCGELLRREAPPPQAAVPAWAPPAVRASAPARSLGVDLLVGLVLAGVFTLTPLLRFMGWFLKSLVHEMGHCAAAWTAGCPAVPAISLQGHAAAVHGCQNIALCAIIWGSLAVLLWRWRRHEIWRWALGAALLIYPVLAFTGVREGFFLIAGQGGELVFATFFLWRAMVGGWGGSRAEDIAYATVGFYLLGANLWLNGGLVFSAKVRLWYMGSGSFGLTNDYLRLAHDMNVNMRLVAGVMLLATVLVPVVAWLLYRRHQAELAAA